MRMQLKFFINLASQGRILKKKVSNITGILTHFGCKYKNIKSIQLHYHKAHPFNCDLPKGNDNAVWIEPNLVCIVQYMPSNKEGMRQPVCKGIREDKEKKECRE